MSRSALWRQEGAKKQREKQAQELFELALEEGRQNVTKHTLPLWGPMITGKDSCNNDYDGVGGGGSGIGGTGFHLHPLLQQALISSPYFQKSCRELHNFSALVDEIYYQVTHVEPWAIGTSHMNEPSTAFCLLLRLMTMRVTTHQMSTLLTHPDSPYIRAIGFLYLRYVGPPAQILQWITRYLHDEESIVVTARGQKQQQPPKIQPKQQQQQQNRSCRSTSNGKNMNSSNNSNEDPSTIGEMVRKLFSTIDWYGTILPRYPLPIEREIQVQVLLAEKTQQRAQKHLANPKTMTYLTTKVGAEIMALYGDDENPVQWYEAVIDRVILRDEEDEDKQRQQPLVRPRKTPKFVVTFPEYGNTETVSLGEIELRGVPLHDTTTTGNSPSNKDDLYDEIRKRERDRVTTNQSKAISRPPPTTKSSLATGGRHHPQRKHHHHRHDLYNDQSRSHASSSPHHHHHRSGYDRQRSSSSPTSTAVTTTAPQQLPPPSSSYMGKTSSLSPQEPAFTNKRSTSYYTSETTMTATAAAAIIVQEKKRKLLAKYG